MLRCPPNFNIEEEMARHMGTRKNEGHGGTGGAKVTADPTGERVRNKTLTAHTALLSLFFLS